jgi:pyridoxamine 5'-phosphate oxidase
MTDWFESLDGFWARMWDTLEDGVARRDAPARHPAFSTVSPKGWPETRTVVLRQADRNAMAVEVHTDLHSGKISSLRSLPRAAFHVWNEPDRLQIRLSAAVTIRSGADTAGIWAQVPDPSRQSYGVTPAPGTPIPNALSYAKSPDPATFAVLHCVLVAVDLVHLGERHRRAAFAAETGWAGQWLCP